MRALALSGRANPDSCRARVSIGVVGEDSRVRGWSLRTLQEQCDANVDPPADFVASHRLPRCVREGHWSLAEVRSAAARHTCNDDEALDLVAADAPPILARSVRFFCAAALIDSSTRVAAVPRRAQATTFSCCFGGVVP